MMEHMMEHVMGHMMKHQEILSVREVSFGYRNHPVLQKVSFTLAPKDFLCLLGPNGVGKSTLFRCILGINTGYSGNIFLGNKNLRTLSTRELAEKIAYIPQYSTPVFGYTVFEMVLMGTAGAHSLFSSPGKAQKEAAHRAIERMGISHLSDRSIAEISGGERQLALIARALAQDADYLLMDEPTANLDYGNQIRVMQMISSLAQQGYGILLSTHNPEHALNYANRILVLKNGKVLSEGSPQTAVDRQILNEAYGVNVRIHSIEQSDGSYLVCVPDQIQ